MGLNITWVATVWGLAVGILVGDVLYYLTDELMMFGLTIPCAFAGYYLGRRYQRKMEKEGGILKKRR